MRTAAITQRLAHCVECGCHDMAACVDEANDGPCYWLVVDRAAGLGVCSACSQALDRWNAGDRSIAVAGKQHRSLLRRNG